MYKILYQKTEDTSQNDEKSNFSPITIAFIIFGCTARHQEILETISLDVFLFLN